MTSEKFIYKRLRFYKFFKNNIFDIKNKHFRSPRSGKITTISQAANILKCSTRTVKNNLKVFQNYEAKEFFTHKGVGNRNALVYNKEYDRKLVEKYIEFDNIGKSDDKTIPFTIHHFLTEHDLEGSESTIRRRLGKYVLGYFARKNTKRNFEKKKSSEITNPMLEKIIKKAFEFKVTKTHLKENLPFGQITEVDGCSNYWLPTSPIIEERDRKATIHGMCDSSGYLLSAKIDWEETNNGYIALFTDVFTNYGAPSEIRGDKRTSFQYRGLQNTKIGQAINSLNINLRCESYGQFKANMERAWGATQPWLPKHLAIKGIRTYKQLFEYINEGDFVKDYNNYFNKQINLSKGNNFRKLFDQEIKAAFVVKESRTVKEGNFFKIDNQYYYPINNKGERVIMSEENKHSTFKIYTDMIEGKMFIKIHNQKYYLKLADYTSDYIERESVLKALESDVNMIIYEQDKIIRMYKSEINKLQSMILNSSDYRLASSLKK